MLKSRAALIAALVLAAGGVCGYLAYTWSGPGRAALVGKWLLAEEGTPHGLEFRADGTFRVARYRLLPKAGTWTFSGGRAETTYADGTVLTPHVSITGEELTLQAGDEKTVWRRVEGFPEESDHPNGRPSDRQRAWIVGAWQGTMKSTFAATAPHRFDFFADGTYAHLMTDRGGFGGPRVTVQMGTYRFHPGTDNFIELTSEDTGATETRHAVVTADKLALCDGRDGTTARDLVRVTEARGEMWTADAGGVRTAFGLYRALKQDRAKAEAAMKARPVVVHGVVGSSTIGGAFADVYLYTGAKQCVRCVFADPPQVSRFLHRAVRLGRPWRVVVRGTYEGLFKETGRGKLLEMFSGLKIDDTDAPPVLRLGKCALLGAAVLRPPGPGPAGLADD